MARVSFDDGTVINFNGNPTPQDIEEAYNSSIGSRKQRQSSNQPGFDIGQIPALLAQKSVEPIVGAFNPRRDFADPLGVKPALMNVPAPEFSYPTIGGVLGSAVAGPAGSIAGSGIGGSLGRAVSLAKQGKGGEVSDLKDVAIRGIQTAAVDAALLGAGKVIGKSYNFLRGNPKGIQNAEKALDKAAHQSVGRLRKGGDLHDVVINTLRTKSDEAWAPMTEVVKAIPDEIPMTELKAMAAQRFADSPGRMQAVNFALDNLSEAKISYSASELSDLSVELGRMTKKAVIKGKAAASFTELVNNDIRTLVADVLEVKAPLPLKGFVAQAKQNWARYATDRDALFKYFSPGAVLEEATTSGANLLRRAAKGTANFYEESLLKRFVESSGIDLITPLLKPASKLRRAEAVGQLGKLTAKSLPWVAGATATGAVLKNN